MVDERANQNRRRHTHSPPQPLTNNPFHSTFTLWNPNGLSQKKLDWLFSRLPGSLTPDICFFTESHLARQLNLPTGWKIIQNPHNYHGVAVAYSNKITISNIWKSDDCRAMSFIIQRGDTSTSIFLGYWPATNSTDRKAFNNKHKDRAAGADVVLGDFNSVEDTERDSTWTHPHLSPDFETLIVNKIDPAIKRITQDDSLHTNHHREKTSRIDRVYAIKESNISFINNLDFISNDSHCPVLYAFEDGKSTAPASWRLNSGLFLSRKSRKLLKEALPSPANTTAEGGLEYLDKIKEATMNIQKKIIKKQKKDIHRAKGLLRALPPHAPKRREIEQFLAEMGERNLEKKKLLAGKKWTLYNECPNAMLTRILKSENSKSKVHSIRHPTTKEVVNEPEEVMDAFFTFYKELYKEQHIDETTLGSFLRDWNPDIDQETLNKLDNPFSREELDTAYKQMRDLKAPGTSGMPTLPFKLLPEDGMEKLLATFNEIMASGSVPADWKKGEVITLFKKGDVLELGNRRPITLLETEYKILSKMVTNRMNDLIPQIIHKDQVGFIPGRIIYDNVLTAHEILKQEEKYTISVDFAKAYDSISHTTIFKVLEHLKFPARYIELIKGMISGSTARVRNGDLLTDFYDVDRGVKQGCPLSPLLFALVIEPLAHRIRNETIGAPLGTIKQAISLYADDIFLFAADFNEQLKQISILDEFRLASGLTMNKDKSLHISSHNLNIGIPPCTQEGFKYLGFWMNHRGLMNRSNELMGKLRAAVQRWKYFSWNTRQKASVLQTYIMSKIWYYSFIMDMDDKIEEITNLRKEFLWSNSYHGITSKRTKQRQERSEISRKNGGLGLDNLQARFNAQKAWIINMCFTRETKIASIWKEQYGLTPGNSRLPFGNPDNLLQGYWSNYIKLPQDLIPKEGDCTSRLKEWTEHLSGKKDEPIRTKRQKRLLVESKVDLIEVFNNVRKKVRDTKMRNFVWNFCHGTLIYDRNKNCPCGQPRNTEHIFFTCNRITPIIGWYSNHSYLTKEASAISWSEKDVLSTLETSDSQLTIALYSSLLRALWHSREAPIPSLRIFRDSLQSIMVAEWYYARYHPDHKTIPHNLEEKFKKRWELLYSFSRTGIPILKNW